MVVLRLTGLAIFALALCAIAPAPAPDAKPANAVAPSAVAKAPGAATVQPTGPAPTPAQVLATVGPAVSTEGPSKGASKAPGERWSSRDYALVFGPIATAFVALIAVGASIRNTSNTLSSTRGIAQAQRWRDANQDEIEKIETLIRTFHVPYLVRSEANHNLALDIRSRQKDPEYRMLVSLFDPDWRASLSLGDQRLVGEVCETGLKLRDFIEENAGGVDERLTEHLARAYTHFRILHLAYKHELGSDPTPFQAYVYPRQLDAAIKTDLDRLVKRRDLLRAQPSEDHGQVPSLALPAEAILPAWLGAAVERSASPGAHSLT